MRVSVAGGIEQAVQRLRSKPHCGLARVSRMQRRQAADSKQEAED